MKSIMPLILGISIPTLSVCQDTNSTKEPSVTTEITTQPNNFLSIKDCTAFFPFPIDIPGCIIPMPPPQIIFPWEEWIIGSIYVQYMPIQRAAEPVESCFGYCEASNFCYETIQTDNMIIINLLAYEDVTIEMKLNRLNDKSKQIVAYPLISSPLKFKAGYYSLEQQLKHIPDATFVLKMKVNGELITSRIQSRSEDKLWKVDKTCISKMNLLDPVL
ncbi:MAG: hypothetical protein H6582_04080 [Crocinitomicaceae bacterium]|nr:hypothetical protein [Crocinitomicaceae bacterium]